MLASKSRECLVELVRRESVGFRGHDQQFTMMVLQPLDQLLVGLLRRHIGIDQTDTQPKGPTAG